MKVIVECVLIENFLINFIVLKTTSLFLREKGKRFVLASFFGACLCVALPALNLNAVGHFLVQLGQMCVTICLAFNFKTLKKFLRVVLTYFSTACAYGGAVFYCQSLIGQNLMIVVLLVVILMFMAIKFLKSRHDHKACIDNFCLDVEIGCQGKKISCKGFLDSGNMLTDPVTKMPVCLINFKMFSKLFEQIEFEDVLTKSKKLMALKFAHYIDFNTLNNSDKILVFQVDRLVLGGKTFENQIMGLSFKNFNQTFSADVIVHNNFAMA